MILYRFFTSSNHISPLLLSQINSLLFQLNPVVPPATQKTLRLISVHCRLLLAVDSRTQIIVGMAILNISHKLATPNFGVIEDVVVDTAYRNRGIGKTLILKLIAKAHHLKLSHIDLTSNPSRTTANQLYQSLGFTSRPTNSYRLSL